MTQKYFEMFTTPKKLDNSSAVYQFFEDQNLISKKYKCKSCELSIVGSATNLLKHINTTNEKNTKILS